MGEKGCLEAELDRLVSKLTWQSVWSAACSSGDSVYKECEIADFCEMSQTYCLET